VQLTFTPPLVRWDGLHVVLHLGLVEQRLKDLLRGVEAVREASLAGAGDGLRLTATVVWKGRHARVSVELAEIRLRLRRLGFRVRRVRLLGGVPVPRAVVGAILRSLDLQLVTVVGGRGIVIVDLARWIPPELTLAVLTVQVTEQYVHLWLGPGELRDLPAVGPSALPASATPVLPR
jgi:hypothetical protein